MAERGLKPRLLLPGGVSPPQLTHVGNTEQLRGEQSRELPISTYTKINLRWPTYLKHEKEKKPQS
jgi:hypothetical protein